MIVVECIKLFILTNPLCVLANEFSHVRDNALSYYKEMKIGGYDNPKIISKTQYFKG